MPRTFRQTVQIPSIGQDIVDVQRLVVEMTEGLGTAEFPVKVVTSGGQIDELAREAFDLVRADERLYAVEFIHQQHEYPGGDLLLAFYYSPDTNMPERNAVSIESSSEGAAESATAFVARLVDGFASEVDRPDEPLDEGLALLAPVTQREYATVESILAVLWKAADHEALTDGQQAQIRALANLVSSEHRSIEPGTTQRWRLVGVVRGALAHLARSDLPRNVLAWKEVVDLVTKVGWSQLAQVLESLLA